MAIKAGQILHVMNQFVVDRIQTAGPGDLNIPQERVYELGNYQSVGIVRDVPDLSFNLECLDVSTEVEALLTGSSDPGSDATSTKYSLANNVPVDILSPWKTPYGDYATVHGVVIPALALESASYRYGFSENAGETFTLNGDSIYYVPGTPWQDIGTGDGTTEIFTFEHPDALTYSEGGDTFYALCVSVDGQRCTQIARADLAVYATLGETLVYADTSVAGDGIEFAIAPANDAVVSICYGSDEDVDYTQTGQDPWGSSGTTHLVHQGVAVKPAAIRGRDIDVYFSTGFSAIVNNKALTSNVATLTTASAHGLTVGEEVTVSGVDGTFNGTYTVASVPTATTFTYPKTASNVSSTAVSPTGLVSWAVEVRWPDVQSVNIDWRVTLEEDYEFGNARSVARDATDVPAVTGSVELRPRSVEAFFSRLRQITGVAAGAIIGPQSSVVGALRVELRNPESGGATGVAAGTVLKTHYIPEARFTVPGYSGQVQQKMNVTVNFESDTGVLEVFKGTRS